MRNIFLLLLLFFFKGSVACECPAMLPISEETSSGYNVIFYGLVDSVSKETAKNKVFFTIHELYKGSIEQQVKVYFDATSECMMSFEKGELWLMYCTFERFDELSVDFCSHSRKLFKDPSLDFYQLAAQRSFVDEKLFLEKTFGIQALAQSNEINQQQINFKPRNEQPSAGNKFILLLVSFGIMIIVYFITRNKNKKNGK